MDTAPWPQGIVVKPMDEIVVTNTVYQKPPTPPPSSISERKARTQKDHYHHQQALKCPRCNSTNTKFCYYNNYSLSQPRFFCKTCRRYWTEGGSLRNIPVGGGSRKNKRSHNSSSSSSSTSAAIDTSSSSKKLPGNNLMLPPPHITQQNPNNKIHGNTPQDLNLGYAATNPDEDGDDHGFKSLSEMIQVQNSSAASDHSLSNISAMELLTGFTGSRGLDNSGFVPLTMTGTIGTNADHQRHDHPNAVYSTGLPLSADEFMKQPSLSFSLDGLGNNYGSFQGVRENNGKILFPFEDLKHRVSSESANGTADQKENGARHGDNSSTAGFWNGVIGGGSW